VRKAALVFRRPLAAPPLMQDFIVGFIAVACLVYLVVAVLYPEKF
jgi:K+-transporting ATPase KdpF subunit